MTDHDDTPSTEERDGWDDPTQREAIIDMWRRRGFILVSRETVRKQVPAGGEEMRNHELRMTIAELQDELAKLRAAADPAELPGDWSRTDEHCIDRTDHEMSVHLWADGRVAVVGRDEAFRSVVHAVPASVLRHLLALPPQEDVRGAIAAERKAVRDVLETAVYQAGNESCDAGHERMRVAIRTVIRMLRPTAPRTEGGGDHGE